MNALHVFVFAPNGTFAMELKQKGLLKKSCGKGNSCLIKENSLKTNTIAQPRAVKDFSAQVEVMGLFAKVKNLEICLQCGKGGCGQHVMRLAYKIFLHC